MNKKFTSIATTSIFLCLAFNASADGNGGGKHYVFNLIGTGYMYESYVDDIDGDGVDDPAFCFDVNLINAKNQQLIGTGTDCLSNISITDAGISLVGTTTFRIPSGDLVVRGKTSVLPVLQETVTPAGQIMTHITGAAGTGDAVIHGTNLFAGATGTARLSGMVNLSGFGLQVDDPIAFDCLFVVDLD